MFKLVSPDISHKEQWEEIMAEWGNTQKKPAIFFQDNYEKLLEGFQELSVSDDIVKEIPKSSFYFLMDSIDKRIL
jgi:predicted acetyltransferase